jgi:serine/threonine protein kinase/lipoprotein NlpI
VTIKCPKCRFENPDDTRYCGNCAASLKPKKHGPLTETLKAPLKGLLTGSIFAGRYQIIEELSKGSTGRVYKVLDKEINSKLALKLIHSAVSADENTVESLRNELKLARSIVHKNICRLYDINKAEGSHYITMEYVEGQDLRSLIRQTGHLAVPTIVSIVKQVCEGLSEAHRQGIVHRDLKPANIMIDRDGGVHIMDFGVACSLESKGLASVGIICGTPLYMSPEQTESEEVDQRSDIYSLGIILFEMTTGRVPFSGEDLLSVARKHKSEMPTEPRDVNPNIPDDLNRLILRCLAKDKEKRYQSARELHSALSNLQMEFAVADRPDAMKWKNSIAVLPFADLSAEKDQEYFCDGLAEELINVLSRIKGLKVVARTSAFSFKGKDIDIREVGRKLGVLKVLEGSVRRSGNRLRISSQLIDATEGYHIWSERFDREMEDIFAIQDEVTLAIVKKLKINLIEEEKGQLLKHKMKDPDAYNLYLMGRYFFNERTEEGFRKSISYFQKMIKNDPSSSLGYAGLADAYNYLGYFNYLPAEESYSRAREEVENALAIDENLTEALIALSSIKLFYDWNLGEAKEDLQRAIGISPSNITAHHRLAFSLSAMGRHDEAIDEIKQAQAIDPLCPVINTAAAWVLYLGQNYDLALDQCEKTKEIDPHYHVSYVISGLVLLERELFEKAIAAFQRALELERSDIAPLAYLGTAYYRANKKNEAEKILQDIEALSKSRYIAPLYRAVLHTGLGQKNRALEWLEKGYQARIPWMIFINEWPLFDSLKPEPKFKAIVDKLISD